MIGVLAVACTDKAKPDFERCQQLRSNAKPQEALKACEEATGADPKSKAGIAAAALALTIRGEVAEAEAKRKAEDEQQIVETRKKLLASGTPADLARLVKEYGGTPEAKTAETKLRLLTSICPNRADWQPTRAIQRLGERPGQAALLDGMSDAFAAGSASGLATKCEREAKSLDDTASEIAGHAFQPGEEPLRDILVTNTKRLAAQNRKWATAFKNYSGDLGPYAALKVATERVAEQVLEKDTEVFNKCLNLPAGATP